MPTAFWTSVLDGIQAPYHCSTHTHTPDIHHSSQCAVILSRGVDWVASCSLSDVWLSVWACVLTWHVCHRYAHVCVCLCMCVCVCASICMCFYFLWVSVHVCVSVFVPMPHMDVSLSGCLSTCVCARDSTICSLAQCVVHYTKDIKKEITWAKLCVLYYCFHQSCEIFTTYDRLFTSLCGVITRIKHKHTHTYLKAYMWALGRVFFNTVPSIKDNLEADLQWQGKK